MKTFYIYILFIVFITSCSKWVEVERPENMMGEEDIFKNLNNSTSYITSLYVKQIDFAIPGIIILGGCSSDEFDSNLPDYKQFLTNEIDPENRFYYLPWGNLYPIIARANIAINALENNKTLVEKDRERLIGETYFIRAYCFFHLLQFYGQIPLTLSPDPKENMFLAQNTTDEVWSQIISDLKKSQNFLKENQTITNTRANYYTSTALLARCYLYNEKWNEALTESSKVINSKIYNLADLNTLFSTNNKEIIFQLQTEQYYNTLPFLFSSYDPSYPPNITMSKYFHDLLLTNDARMKTYTTTSQNSGTTINKHGFESNQIILFRLAELYLIRAEANIMLNNFSEANTDINIIRKRAQIDNINIENQIEGRLEIENQRAAEFFGEYPHRWFDLKRWKGVQNNALTRADEILSKIEHKKWKKTGVLFPITNKDLINNNNLKQNLGYN